MSNWFFAANGQQQGPYPDAQFQSLIGNGTVHADTLVWTEGMPGWQKASEVPGLMAVPPGPPMVPHGAQPPMMAGGAMSGAAAGAPGQALVADLPLWGLLGRALLMAIGTMLVVPAPWVATWFYSWFFSHVQVPGRGNLSFTGQPLDIWWVFMLLGLTSYIGAYDNTLQLLSIPIQAFLGWMILKWVVGNLAANGQKLPLAFNGSVIGYIGWQLLTFISFITIIGWAWVVAYWVRWICRNISGTRREIVFNGSGWQILWRTIVMALLSTLIIPIPWVLRWYARWYVSQFALVPRGA
jgi:hypothetical protein